ncbi:MAG: peroxidase family protein [Xenococcaceae cyanobacterium MO_167.B52]|nr:peroxidase family protein [Xenococcaceae cyanobacterium MO_167.B52]
MSSNTYSFENPLETTFVNPLEPTNTSYNYSTGLDFNYSSPDFNFNNPVTSPNNPPPPTAPSFEFDFAKSSHSEIQAHFDSLSNYFSDLSDYYSGLQNNDFVFLDFAVRSLDGSGNHPQNLGRANTPYRRIGDANYVGVDGFINEDPEKALPNARDISNLIFNDLHINLFSERDVSHLVFGWGQFLDHTFGLAEGGGAVKNIPFEGGVFEEFNSELGHIPFRRSVGVVENGALQQNNTVSSFNDGWNVYGPDKVREEWIREGIYDGNGDTSNNGAKLLLIDGFLPRRRDRGNVNDAPEMDLMGRLRNNPGDAVVAGDVRANENTALTALHTLFAREHNRVVDIINQIHPHLSEEAKFQIARKHVIATQQHITYNEFLPAVGVAIDPYEGYDPTLDPRLSNEFATVGYRAHSMVHGDFDIPINEATAADIAMLERQGAKVDGDVIEVPAITQFGNADVVSKLKLGPVFRSLVELNYNNDETIDNQLRSVLFQALKPGTDFGDGPGLPDFVTAVNDIGAIDVQRGRDHGMPFYNDLREDYGLSKADDFYDVTSEDINKLKGILDKAGEMGFLDPEGGVLNGEDLITDVRDFDPNDSSMIDILLVLDKDMKPLFDFGDIQDLFAQDLEVEGIFHIKRSTLAVRLEHLYEDIDHLEAFPGMVSEKHLPNSELGELQHAMWKAEFENMRDADKFFYLNESELADLAMFKATYGIDPMQTLSDVIKNNTSFDDVHNPFFAALEAEVEV